MAGFQNKLRTGADPLVRQTAWHTKRVEAPIDPELPIIDPHHHVWDRESRYLIEELADDVYSGHNIISTVFVQCAAMYRADGDPAMAPTGETEFVNGIAAMAASGLYGKSRLCEGIVGFADLRMGAAVEKVLEQHLRVGGGRFRGVRHASNWDTDPEVQKVIRLKVPRHVLNEVKFYEGFAKLGPLGLSFDVWTYFHQLDDVSKLAKKFPGTAIIVDHIGGLLGMGSYAGRKDEIFAAWRKEISSLAQNPNVMIKLGGLGMHSCGFHFEARDTPPTSQELADVWRPYLEHCIEAFGVDRAMFESNFPVDKQSCSYVTLWNAFKRIAQGYSEAEKVALFRGTAARVYRLQPA